jgi:hypothetical protein
MVDDYIYSWMRNNNIEFYVATSDLFYAMVGITVIPA